MNSISKPFGEIDDQQLACLRGQGFTTGLAKSLWRNSKEFPLRIWIVDNSGSMNAADGKRLVETSRKHDVKLVPCSRWAELKECVKYHAHMAALLEAPTRFILLNDPGVGYPQEFGISLAGPSMLDQEMSTLERTMSQTSPHGVTPLTKHLEEIYDTVSAMEPSLRQAGQRVAVVVATDGLPTDFRGMHSSTVSLGLERALAKLGRLPVWMVIRLCTNDDEVIQYYETLDSQLELSLEVLDDFCDEAREVYQMNPWLNYALPLHRCREMGFHNRLFDLLDERPFMPEEIADFLRLVLFSRRKDIIVDPVADWEGFCKQVSIELQKQELQWNPIRRKLMPWIDMKALRRLHGGSGTLFSRWRWILLMAVIAYLAMWWPR